ncbi:hypothetical protein PH552_32220 [Rhizobium sp. CNPSo 3968]|uniref:hypothetical protein n=1 Tax=Rhizobium sp. CNPSo 3968 TaxID=3021408 RepID=UPI00254D32C0|nr:hypothetical protein [Rhizobium sp. CNPSo 3968]MDK4724025.1 hypothetical protein [Rhizobium sp. CNPSo 3968]
MSIVKGLPRRVALVLFDKFVRVLSKNPALKDMCLRLMRRSPWIGGRVVAFARVRGYGEMAGGPLDNDEAGQWHIDAPKGATAKWTALLQTITDSK